MAIGYKFNVTGYMFIIFDCGATNLRVALSENKKTFKKVVILETPRSLNKIADLIHKTALEISDGKKVKAVAGGITGFFDNTKGEKIAKLLKNKFNTKVSARNDTALVGLGEAHFGAGKGLEIVEYITVSTGVGGARIVDGKIDKTAQGFEIGHQIINFDKNKKETLEGLVSGKAISKKFKKDPREIKDKKVWDDLAYTLSIGVYNSILHWSPEVVVIGGPMIVGSPAIPIKKVEKHLKQLVKIFPKVPKVKKANLKNLGGLYGALVLLK